MIEGLRLCPVEIDVYLSFFIVGLSILRSLLNVTLEFLNEFFSVDILEAKVLNAFLISPVVCYDFSRLIFP